MAKRAKRDWYIGYGNTSGEHAGQPLSFEQSEVFGPFTESQANELLEWGREFPIESRRVVAFQKSLASFRSLKNAIRVDLEQAKKDAEDSAEEMRENVRRR